MDLGFTVFSVVLGFYMAYLFLSLNDKFLSGCFKYYLTPLWLYRKEFLTPEGIKIRRKIIISMSLYIFASALYFWT